MHSKQMDIKIKKAIDRVLTACKKMQNILSQPNIGDLDQIWVWWEEGRVEEGKLGRKVRTFLWSVLELWQRIIRKSESEEGITHSGEAVKWRE